MATYEQIAAHVYRTLGLDEAVIAFLLRHGDAVFAVFAAGGEKALIRFAIETSDAARKAGEIDERGFPNVLEAGSSEEDQGAGRAGAVKTVVTDLPSYRR